LSEHRLGPQDAGRTIDVAAGDRIVIALPETAGTGYTWTVESLPSGGHVVDEGYEHEATGIGGASRHVFGIDVGEGGPVGLRLARPWEREGGAVERYEVVLRVSGAPAPPR
jgi:predicted secreted protein